MGWHEFTPSGLGLAADAAIPFGGTTFAFVCFRIPTRNHTEETNMAMGNRAIWAILWVIGIPLPVLMVLYFLTGGGCGN